MTTGRTGSARGRARVSGLTPEARRATDGPTPGGRASAVAAATVVAVLLGLLVLLAPPRHGWAQQPADLGATVTIGHGRGAAAHSWTLVEVIASPAVPVAGQLDVRTEGPTGRAAATRDLEVAAGATKVVHLLLPPAEHVQVRFLPAGGDPVELRPGPGRHRGAVLVGGLGPAPPLPDPLATVGTDRAVRGVPVDPAILALGSRALEDLDALLVDQRQLAGLSDAERRTLESAVVAGLDLLVTVAPDGPDIALPWNPVEGVTGDGRVVAITPSATAWPLTLADLGEEGGEEGDEVVAAAVLAGRGRVVALASDGTLAPGSGGGARQATAVWQAVLQPRAELARELGSDEGEVGGRLFGGATSLPGARGAALFLLAFLVLVGPVNALVVRRLGRRELSWVTVPAIALVFTGVAAITTAGGEREPSPVLRAAWWLDGVGQEVTAVALQSPGRGVQQVTFPGARDPMVHQPWGSTVGTSERLDDVTVLGAHLEALQAVTAVAWGRTTAAPPLAVTASLDGSGRLDVVVENTSAVALDGVRVKVATHEVAVGTLAAGEERDVTIDDLGESLPPGRFDQMQMLMDRPRPAADQGPAAAARLLAWSPLEGTPGTVWASGHTTDPLGLGTPQVDGGVEDRGTFVAVGVVPDLTEATDGLPPHLVRRDLLRSDETWLPWRPDPLTIEGQEEVVLRFRLPEPDVRGPLVSTLDRGGELEQAWVDDPWGDGCFEVTEFDEAGEQLGETEERCGPEVACPPGSTECGGDDRQVEACFEDGRCQLAVRTDRPEQVAPDEDVHEGFEVYDHAAARWVPAREAFADGADTSRVLSPLGEVLVRARQVGWFGYAQRGLAVRAGDEPPPSGGDA
jgi:hypothetical protein